MIGLQKQQMAGVNVIPLDPSKLRGKNRHKSLFARCLAGLLRALHDSRRRQGEHVIRRYRHLTCVSDAQGGRHSDAVPAGRDKALVRQLGD
jgi:hypothetical protein